MKDEQEPRYVPVDEVCKDLARRCIAAGHGSKSRWARKAGVSSIYISQMTLGQKRRTLPPRVLKALGYDTRVYYKRKEKR